jgi:YD repeat-containing protein
VIFTYAYDANGRLTNRWTPAKGNTRYIYDASGNLTNVDYATSADISMQYDANNRLTSMIDGVGTTSYSYTDFGALLSEDGPWADDTVSYSYTSNRLRSQLTLLQANAASWVQVYTYDATLRLTGISSPAGSFAYS